MLNRSMSNRRACAVLVATSLLLGGRVLAAPSTGSGAAEELIVAAEQALEDEQFAEAGDAFQDAYRKLPDDARSGDLGELVVTEGVAAYDQAYRRDGQARHLVHAQDLLRSAARDRGGVLPTAELRAELDRITSLLDKLEESDEQDEPPPEPRPPEAAATPRDRSMDATAGQRVDRTGVALTTVGALAFLGGVGLTANGGTLTDRAHDRLADRGGMTPGDDAYVRDAERLRTAYIAAGAAVMATGLAIVVWGAVRLARHRPGRRSGPEVAGPRIRLRF